MLLAKLRSVLRGLLRRRRLEREMSDEMAFHLEQRARDLMSGRGLPPVEARRRAQVEFGPMEKYREEGRQSLGLRIVDEAVGDVRYSVRQLRRSPAFSLVEILTMALAIGANTAIFSVYHAVLLDPLPYPEPDRLHSLTYRWIGGESPAALDARTYEYWAANTEAYESVAATIGGGTYVVASGGRAQEIAAVEVTPGFFRTIGVEPLLGRGFVAEEGGPGGSAVVVLSHPAWQVYFGGASDLVGRSLRLSGEPHTVVGILPRGFSYEGVDSAVFKPMVLEAHPQRIGRNYTPLGRLREGLSLESARADADVVYQRFVAANPEYRSDEILGMSAIRYSERVTFNVRPVLWVLLAAVGAILLIACTNIASLLLARMIARAKEISIRTALGAHGLRILRQFFVEGLVFSVFAGAIGVLLSVWGVDALVGMGTGLGARAANATINGQVLFFSIAVSIGTAVVFGLSGVVHVRQTRPRDALRAAGATGRGAGRRKAVNMLVVLETSLSLVLLIGATLLIATVYRLHTIPFGFDTENLVSAELVMSGEEYLDPAAQAEFERRLRERVRTIPGVVGVASASGTPLVNTLNHVAAIEGAESQRIYIEYRSVSTEYFETVGIPLVRGRSFGPSETAPVAIANETFAGRFPADVDPIGRRILLAAGTPQRDVPRELVGIVQDVLDVPPGEPGVATLYIPRTQANTAFNQYINNGFNPSVLMRVQRPSALGEPFRTALAEIDPLVPVRRIRTMDEIVSDATTGQRFNMLLMSLFAASALVLSFANLYGVLSYQVAQRTPEIGVRMALGARRSTVLRMVVGHGATLAVVGAGIGLTAAYGLTRLLASMIYGVTPTDVVLFALATLVVMAVSVLASCVPATRAARVDPMTALRDP